MKYKNHIDNYYYLLYGTVFASCIIASILILILHATKLLTILGILCLIISFICLYLFNSRNYEITNKNLIIRVGPFKKTYKLKDIKRSVITRNRKLSYATSIKKINILFKNGKEIGISPIKMEEVLMKIINKGVTI